MQLAVQTGSFGGRGILVRVFTTSRVALEQEGLGIASQHANFKMRKLCFPGIQAELQIFLRINIHVDFPLLIAKLVVFGLPSSPSFLQKSGPQSFSLIHIKIVFSIVSVVIIILSKNYSEMTRLIIFSFVFH